MWRGTGGWEPGRTGGRRGWEVGEQGMGSGRTGWEAGSEIKKAIVCCLLLGIIQSKTLI